MHPPSPDHGVSFFGSSAQFPNKVGGVSEDNPRWPSSWCRRQILLRHSGFITCYKEYQSHDLCSHINRIQCDIELGCDMVSLPKNWGGLPIQPGITFVSALLLAMIPTWLDPIHATHSFITQRLWCPMWDSIHVRFKFAGSHLCGIQSMGSPLIQIIRCLKDERDERHGHWQHWMWRSPNSNLNLSSIRRVQRPNKKNVIDTLDLGTGWCGLHVQSTIRLCYADLPLNLTWTNDPRQIGVKWLIFLISPPI